MPDEIDLSQYPVLAEKEPEFKALVSGFVARLAGLSETQKSKLALFKAIELTNALVQIREQENSPQRLGPEKAAASFKIVRAALRERQITLLGQEVVTFDEPELKAIIDEGSRTFHAGKHDPEQWQQAMAFSTAQYIILHPYLPQRLQEFHHQYQDLFPPELAQEITARFITPYQVQGEG